MLACVTSMQMLSVVQVGKRALGNGLHYMVHHVSVVCSNTCNIYSYINNKQYLLNIDNTRNIYSILITIIKVSWGVGKCALLVNFLI